MEIPVVNRISDFQSRITSLPDPSFFSQAFSISGIERVSQACSFWKWGALIIAILASFGTILTKINIFITRLRRLGVLSSQAVSQKLQDDDFSDIDDDDDDTCSISSSSSLSDDELESDSEISYDNAGTPAARDEHFLVRGSGYYGDDREQNLNSTLRRRRSFGGHHRFSWSDFTSGKSVVKLWDTSSPATFLSADTSVSGRASIGVWDTRVGCRFPAILADWGPQLGRIVGVASGGVEKLYVKDGVTGALTVGDVRKAESPLRNVTDADVDDTWWDADAVIVTDERFDESAVSGCDWAVTRCCSAVRSYLL
ncbi:PREDICTED: uncharacterized protein LOC103341496 [Prunus mume]|uniref:Uncharacterized protein LOC103341496 n=1 Tax=Prunus mume TaxID=102107 RepID=A0ABM0PR72_PRUMU|nr:PREDICTED: uncharacterized protein LOC103341496 [Prunus mume]